MPAQRGVRKRRTQEERSTETRDKIVRGAAKCIVEQGYKAATMKAIAEAAGITWGAIQHHFGDKESILKSVTDLGAIEFRERIQHINLAGMSIQERVDEFLAQAQKQTEDDLYIASMEIFRNLSQKVSVQNYSLMEQVMLDTWEAVFGDVNISKQRHGQVMGFTYMTVNAIAMERMSFQGGETHTKSHFRLLNECLVNLLNQ